MLENTEIFIRNKKQDSISVPMNSLYDRMLNEIREARTSSKIIKIEKECESVSQGVTEVNKKITGMSRFILIAGLLCMIPALFLWGAFIIKGFSIGTPRTIATVMFGVVGGFISLAAIGSTK